MALGLLDACGKLEEQVLCGSELGDHTGLWQGQLQNRLTLNVASISNAYGFIIGFDWSLIFLNLMLNLSLIPRLPLFYILVDNSLKPFAQHINFVPF